MTRLSFYGAAGTVTGSCSMVETQGRRFLVDCGMFQGNKTVRALNDGPFPFDPAAAEFLLLTHAHIDHSGLLPKLVKHGFKGAIHCTAPTADLLGFMLLDSAKIQRMNAERMSRRRLRRGEEPLEPIYVEEHAEAVLELLQPVELEQWIEPAPGIKARYWNAGHILGSASIELKFADSDNGNTMRLLFSGDLGPDEKVFHPEPDAGKGFDYIICESTYGDRERDDYTLATRREHIRAELTEGLKRGGNIVIPCFAVERSQELLHDIGWLLANDKIPPCTVFLDSPLATRVTGVFIKHAHTLDDIAVDEEALFRHPNFRLVEDVEESKDINRIKSGAVIISASGMADAGRVQHHIKHNIWRRKSTILFVGYQAPGTLGHYITSGATDVRIHGKEFKIKAAIRRLGNYSAHADQSELIDWIVERGPVAGGIFLNHGDDEARGELRRLLGKKGFDINDIHLPQFDESFDITAGTPKEKGRVASAGRDRVRIPQTELLTDWYNDYAALIIELTNRLEGEKDDDRRRELIKQMRGVLR